MKHQSFNKKALTLAVLLAIGTPAFAETGTDDADENKAVPTANLGKLFVTFQKRLSKKSEETTGLGKTVKTAEDINNAQVLSVKDLVKDTAGVAVVEQGRGASSGFSIRGMDKNRVAVSVDGINQIQSYLVQKRQFGDGQEGSGAINEIEIENIGGLQISQGASGTESGSGGLGGAVSFATKGISDVLSKEKLAKETAVGLTHKLSYASRDNHWVHSVGLGAKWERADAFVQYTSRSKNETRPHKDIFNTNYHIWRWAGTPEDFANGSITPDTNPKRQFVIIDECPTYQAGKVDSVMACVKPKLVLKPVKETMNAKQYTGDKRVLGDPMDYDSKSILAKVGYQFTPAHRWETVVENTTQRYNTQDMTMPAYHLTPAKGEGNLAQSYLVYRGQNYGEGYRTDKHIGLWTQSRFFDETHQKQRYGLAYQYKADKAKAGFFDNARLSFDNQTVSIDHLQLEKYCSPYPIVDKNCVAGFDKPNSGESQTRKVYDERHTLIKGEVEKSFNIKHSRHRLSAQAGFDKFRSNLWIGDGFERYYHLDFSEETYFANPAGGFIDVYRPKERYEALDVCKDGGQYLGEARKCGDRTITGYNGYVSAKSTSFLGDLVNLSLGVRYDKHRFDSADDWTGTGSYGNTSWNVGLVVKPSDTVDILYRASSGYRVPSFKELFGYRLDGLIKGQNDNDHYRTNVKPERALNQEIGVAFKGSFGEIEGSYFDNRYKDLIDLTLKTKTEGDPSTLQWGYRNYQDVHLAGVSVGAKLYLDNISDKFPTGLTGKFAYLRTQVKKNDIKDGFYWGSGYFLDSISPTRYVLGADYVADNDKWGLGATWIITDPKQNSELTTIVASPDGTTYQKQATKLASSGWTTLDLTAFYRPAPFLTVRLGVQNALNHRYTTWESLRQTSVTAGNAHSQGLPAQYAAAGRSVVLSFESKF